MLNTQNFSHEARMLLLNKIESKSLTTITFEDVKNLRFTFTPNYEGKLGYAIPESFYKKLPKDVENELDILWEKLS